MDGWFFEEYQMSLSCWELLDESALVEVDVMEEKPWTYLEETLVRLKDQAVVEESDIMFRMYKSEIRHVYSV